jgi:hypothetical protein
MNPVTLNYPDTATRLNLSYRRLDDLVSSGALTLIRVNGKREFLLKSINQFEKGEQ